MKYYYVITDIEDTLPRIPSVYSVEAKSKTEANAIFLQAFLPLINLNGVELTEIASIFRDYDYEISMFDESNINTLK